MNCSQAKNKIISKQINDLYKEQGMKGIFFTFVAEN